MGCPFDYLENVHYTCEPNLEYSQYTFLFLRGLRAFTFLRALPALIFLRALRAFTFLSVSIFDLFYVPSPFFIKCGTNQN